MNADPISSAVKTFIAQQVRSVVELECLLLLQQDAARSWTPGELGRELRIDEQWANRQMMDLAQRGLLVCDDPSCARYRYAPADPAVDALVRQLASDYAERRVSVIELIYAKPSDPLQSFADAFKFRKERPNG